MFQTYVYELRSSDEFNTLVTRPFQVNRTRTIRGFESQASSHCKINTSLIHLISYRTTI